MFLLSIILILLLGFFTGELTRKLGAPPLVGMILIGIVLGSEVSNLIAPEVMEISDELRTIAVTIILMRAGLGLDKDKLIKQGNVALRLGILPALAEMLVITLVASYLFDLNFVIALLLGCVISAESPAVIVPGMLKLKNLGWGTKKGIPDAILTGSALSDVFVFLLFSLLINFLSQDSSLNNALLLLPLQIITQVILGIAIGYLIARLAVWIILQQKKSKNIARDTLIVTSLALLIVVLSKIYPYFSGYLAAMSMGFFIVQFNPPLARKLRIEFNHLWFIAEIFLFVLMGASIQLSVLENILIPGLFLLAVGLVCGRTIGWYLSTIGSNWSWREKLFLLPGNSAKATVQAAISAIPLSLNIPGGEIILAMGALSILVTAPLGAWAIPTFAPKLLSKDPVDRTKITKITQTILLVIIDKSALANSVLTKAGDIARRCDGDLVVVNSLDTALTNKLLLDISYQSITVDYFTLEIATKLIQDYQITDIIIGKKCDRTIANIFREIPIPLINL